MRKIKNRKTDLNGKIQQVIKKVEWEPTLGESFVKKLNEIRIRCNLNVERVRQIEDRALLLLQPEKTNL